MFIPLGVVYCVSYITGVGLIGVVSGDGISSTLTTSGSFYSLSCDCTCALVLNLECLEVWLSFSFFGGAIVEDLVVRRA
jgi:hypothetical protein